VASFTRKEVKMRILVCFEGLRPYETEFLSAIGGRKVLGITRPPKGGWPSEDLKKHELFEVSTSYSQEVWDLSEVPLPRLREVELPFHRAKVEAIRPWPISETKDGILVSVIKRGTLSSSPVIGRWERDPSSGYLNLLLLSEEKLSFGRLVYELEHQPLTEEEERKRREEAERQRKEKERRRKMENISVWKEVLEEYVQDLRSELERVEAALSSLASAEDPLEAYEDLKDAYYALRMEWPAEDC